MRSHLAARSHVVGLALLALLLAWKEMGSLLDFALLQLLCLLKSEQSRFERVQKIVYRRAKSSNYRAP